MIWTELSDDYCAPNEFVLGSPGICSLTHDTYHEAVTALVRCGMFTMAREAREWLEEAQVLQITGPDMTIWTIVVSATYDSESLDTDELAW
jgi:hypothetical protein